MWYRLNLRTRIYLILTALIGISLVAGLTITWYNNRLQVFMSEMIDKNVLSFRTAMALETALVNQKGFVTYFFLDGDPDWLRQLSAYRQVFSEHLGQARKLAQNKIQQKAIDLIASKYETYMALKDRVIAHYKAGERKEGAALHKTARRHFIEIIELCDAYRQMHFKQMQQAQADSRRAALRLELAVITTVAVQSLLVILLGLIFIRQILVPVKQLLNTTSRGVPIPEKDNMMAALSRSVGDLLVFVDKTQTELEKSRENLLQAEKLATVGKLAAGMAHSIRNPFTSVKMRLFSLSRSLTLNTTQEEDFEVISQEIRHIDTIVQNFLEFSRPPKLAMQSVSPSVIVDNAVQLLEHRLKSYGVTVKIVRSHPLPEVSADPEQLKEVLVNLIINACEAMKNGGTIVINEQVDNNGRQQQAVIRLADSGPGIPKTLADKIFQPFFTTKEDGTGLGLSIASRIIDEHNGSLFLQPLRQEGATFVIRLPMKEAENEFDFDN